MIHVLSLTGQSPVLVLHIHHSLNYYWREYYACYIAQHFQYTTLIHHTNAYVCTWNIHGSIAYDIISKNYIGTAQKNTNIDLQLKALLLTPQPFKCSWSLQTNSPAISLEMSRLEVSYIFQEMHCPNHHRSPLFLHHESLQRARRDEKQERFATTTRFRWPVSHCHCHAATHAK